MSFLPRNLVMWTWMLITLQYFDETQQTGTSMVFVKQRNRILQYPEQRFSASKMECAQKCLSDAACVAFAHQENMCTTSYQTTTSRKTESDAYLLDRSATTCTAEQRAGVEDALHRQYANKSDVCKAGTMIMQKLKVEQWVGIRVPNEPIPNAQPDCLQFCLRNSSCPGVEIDNSECYMAAPDFTLSNFTVSPIFLKMDACSDIPVNHSVNSNGAKEFLINYHNEQRSLVARGKFKIKNGTLKAARAMHKLAWNYTLESSAQLEAVKCLKKIREQTGENAQYDSSTSVRANRALYMAQAWIGELQTSGWPGNKYLRNTLPQFIKNAMQVLWAETRQVGCGVETCTTAPSGVSVVCHYWPVGKIHNQAVYAEGDPKCPIGTKQLASGLCETLYS